MDQREDESTENFVAHKRLLFSQLPKPEYEHSELQQIDLIFGQLRFDIKEKMPRMSVKTLDDLLEIAQGIEQINIDRAAAAATVIDKPKATRAPIKKCSFCHFRGHTVDECRKLVSKKRELSIPSQSSLPEVSTQAPSPSQPKFSCYGCGAPGIVRSKCVTCAQRRNSRTPEIGLSSFSLSDVRSRPVIFFEVNDYRGTAHIDSCAKTSVASYDFYCELLKRGYPFAEITARITLADGVAKNSKVLNTMVPVKVNNRVIPTKFVVMPESRDNTTLLGVNFIQDAEMLLNLPQLTCSFIGEDQTYELMEEEFVIFSEPHSSESRHTHYHHVPVPSRNTALPIESACNNTLQQPKRKSEAALPTETARLLLPSSII